MISDINNFRELLVCALHWADESEKHQAYFDLNMAHWYLWHSRLTGEQRNYANDLEKEVSVTLRKRFYPTTIK